MLLGPASPAFPDGRLKLSAKTALVLEVVSEAALEDRTGGW